MKTGFSKSGLGGALAALSLVLSVLNELRGQDLPFDSGSTGMDGAFTTRETFDKKMLGHKMVFDAGRGEMVLFGGRSQNGFLAETWIWDGATWFVRNPSVQPSARAYFAMAYDAARARVIMFGGNPGLNDTWSWDGTNWSQLTLTNSPSPRGFVTMAYDSRRKEIVLFGGEESSGRRLGDTWIWNGTNWIERISPISPTARGLQGMAYDELNGVMVLYSGDLTDGAPSRETWTWDGTNWLQKSPAGTSPPALYGAEMVYDAARQEIVLFGGLRLTTTGDASDETWAWNGSNWSRKMPTGSPPYTSPPQRYYFGMAYDSIRHQVVVAGGGDNSSSRNDTWLWDGTNWTGYSGPVQTFDMRNRPDGVWNFTTINIPVGVAVNFRKDRANSPVRWLASGDINIDGMIDLSGQDGEPGNSNLPLPDGGAGGFAGGLGGTPQSAGGSLTGMSGQGPGGGLAGTDSGQPGQPGTYASTYGNPFIQPLLGGSGGGGSASTTTGYGNAGGGGAGALMLSSSRDITINGTIRADGGAGYAGSGGGSAGAILLRGDRIVINTSARLEAVPDGRIRLESYERAIAGTVLPTNLVNFVLSGPVPDLPGGESVLHILSVAGKNVVQPPRGDLQNPDVTFSQSGDITVTVQGDNVPDGTPVRLRITMTGAFIEKPASGEPNVVLNSSKAVFTLAVPKGRGTVQAIAEFTVP